MDNELENIAFKKWLIKFSIIMSLILLAILFFFDSTYGHPVSQATRENMIKKVLSDAAVYDTFQDFKLSNNQIILCSEGIEPLKELHIAGINKIIILTPEQIKEKAVDENFMYVQIDDIKFSLFKTEVYINTLPDNPDALAGQGLRIEYNLIDGQGKIKSYTIS